MNLDALRTPAFLIDRPKLLKNIARMQQRAVDLGVALRPHVKTHKTVEIARLQAREGAGPITVSTLAEARFFQKAGFQDITYAFPITPDKLAEVAALNRQGRLHLIADHKETVAAVNAAGKAEGLIFCLFLKVDPGYHRAGVDPASDEALALAREIQDSPHIEFKGILGHGGQSYQAKNRKEIVAAAREERQLLVNFSRRLVKVGLPCPEVSAGSTPTAVCGESAAGLTELRPGNYVFFDQFQADIGTCEWDDCAVSVLATVAGHYPGRNRLLVDAGALALSKDPGADHLRTTPSFGTVQGYPELQVAALSQEHGLIESRTPIDFNLFPIGSRIRITPNHSCLTAALFSVYYVLEDGKVIDEWKPVRGW